MKYFLLILLRHWQSVDWLNLLKQHASQGKRGSEWETDKQGGRQEWLWMPLSFIFKAVLKLMLPLSPAPKQHYEAAERESPKDLRDPDPGSLHPLFIRCSRPEAVGFGDTLIQSWGNVLYMGLAHIIKPVWCSLTSCQQIMMWPCWIFHAVDC